MIGQTWRNWDGVIDQGCILHIPIPGTPGSHLYNVNAKLGFTLAVKSLYAGMFSIKRGGRTVIEAKVDLLISNRAEASSLIVLLAVDVSAVVERLVPPPHRPSSLLILKVRP